VTTLLGLVALLLFVGLPAAWLAGERAGYTRALEQAHEALPELTPAELQRVGAI
jgi:hypothetical protein